MSLDERLFYIEKIRKNKINFINHIKYYSSITYNSSSQMLPWCYESRRHMLKLIYLHVLTPNQATNQKEDITPSHITKKNP